MLIQSNQSHSNPYNRYTIAAHNVPWNIEQDERQFNWPRIGNRHANPSHSNANPKPLLTEAIPAHNLGTSALYGTVPSPLVG